ncbi:MAG: WYL domain-containing protein [Myxococcales bacterium]|nr:WYL domain-containing protein [Myxococcales bacterium]
MTDTLLRHWSMLRNLPRAPRKIDTAMLRERLRAAGFDVTQRSLQRDLQALSAVFPLVVDDRHKPFGWSWARTAEPFDCPGMDVHDALAFHLAEGYLAPLLPAASRAGLRHHFERARSVLEAAAGNKVAGWAGKVRAAPAGFQLLPPVIDDQVLESVQDALLHERQLEVVYASRQKNQTQAATVNPLALAWKGPVGYLVVSYAGYTDVRQLALHRVQTATMTGAARTVPPKFDFDAWMRAAGLGFLLGDVPLAVDLAVRAEVVQRLAETPLAEGQTLEPMQDGRVRLRAEVADTNDLRAWLRSYGQWLEVLGPASLRAEMAAAAKATAGLYASKA